MINYFAIPGLKVKTKAPLIDEHHIIKKLAEYFEIDTSKFSAPGRKSAEVFPRQMLCYFLFKYTRLRKVRIAELVNRDYSTIMYTLKAIQNRIDTEQPLREEIEVIRQKICSL